MGVSPTYRPTTAQFVGVDEMRLGSMPTPTSAHSRIFIHIRTLLIRIIISGEDTDDVEPTMSFVPVFAHHYLAAPLITLTWARVVSAMKSGEAKLLIIHIPLIPIGRASICIALKICTGPAGLRNTD